MLRFGFAVAKFTEKKTLLLHSPTVPKKHAVAFIGKIFLLWVVVGCILVAIAQAIHLQ